MPKVSELVHIATQTEQAVQDVPSCAYVTWGTILERIGDESEDHTLEGVPGLLWRGSFTEVVNGLWPDLRTDAETRKQINNYLRATDNMICLKRHAPLWWLRREWNDADVTLPRGFRPIRSGRALAQPRTEAPAGEVVTSYRCANCGYLAETKQALGGHSRIHAAARPAPSPRRPRLVVADAAPPAHDATAAVAEMVERSQHLELENAELRAEVDRLNRRIATLHADTDRLNERIAAINRVLAVR